MDEKETLNFVVRAYNNNLIDRLNDFIASNPY